MSDISSNDHCTGDRQKNFSPEEHQYSVFNIKAKNQEEFEMAIDYIILTEGTGFIQEIDKSICMAIPPTKAKDLIENLNKTGIEYSIEDVQKNPEKKCPDVDSMRDDGY